MRRTGVSILVLSLLMGADTVPSVAARSAKSKAAATNNSARAGGGKTATKNRTSSSLRTVAAANSTSSSTKSLLTNLVRFVGNVYGDYLKYGQSYALQDMLTQDTYNYYYANGSANVNDSGSVLDEQFCFGPYMTLVGRDGTTDTQVYNYSSGAQVSCVTLQAGVVYSLALVEATDTEILNALTTTSQANLANDGRRFAYVSRSGQPVSTMFFNTERYFDVTKYVSAIKSALDKAKSSCGDFRDSMDKLKGQLGWSAVSSGIGTAFSGAATGLGIYNLKKTEEVASDLRKQKNLRDEMNNTIQKGGYYWDDTLVRYDDPSKTEETDSDKSETKKENLKNIDQLEGEAKGLHFVVEPKERENLRAPEQKKYEYCWAGSADANDDDEEAACSACTVNDTSTTPQCKAEKTPCKEGGVCKFLTKAVICCEGADKTCTNTNCGTVEGKKCKLSRGFKNFINQEIENLCSTCYPESGDRSDEKKKKCERWDANVAVWNNMPEAEKKKFALPTLYKKAMDEKAVYSAVVDKSSALTSLSAAYTYTGEKVKVNAGVSRALDGAEAALSGVSAATSGVSMVLSLSAIGEVDKALSTLKTCKTDMANFTAVYNEYMAEAYDEYQDFLKDRDANSGATYDYDN